jgi:Ca-activated chloride channel family protein
MRKLPPRTHTLPRMPLVIGVSLFLLACAAASFSARAQQTDRPPWARSKKATAADPSTANATPSASDPGQDRTKIKVKVDLVNVLVSVLDDHNRPAPDLPKEAFQLFDEQNLQTIAIFEKETQQPLDLALMFDSSLSTQLGMPAQREAATRFIQQVLRPGDRLAVYAVDENVTQIAPFSDNVAHLQEAIKRIPQGAGTSIYDAVFLGSRALARQGIDRRSVIILITDGGETTSHSDFDTARREAVRNGALLYTIVIRAMKNESGRNTAGEHALETITDTTGGAVFYPDSTAQLGGIFDRIDRELRTQYRLGYYPNPRGPADTYRSIDVKVVPPPVAPPSDSSTASASPSGDYTVRHRKSYYTGLP